MEMHDAHDSDALIEKLTDALPILKIYAFALTGDAARAADLLQETSVKVLCNFASYTININFKGWATTIMHNIFVNEYKRAARSVSVADDTFFDCECHCCDVDAAEIMAAISAFLASTARLLQCLPMAINTKRLPRRWAFLLVR